EVSRICSAVTRKGQPYGKDGRSVNRNRINPHRAAGSSPDVFHSISGGSKPLPYGFCGRSVNRNKVNPNRAAG
ncbi:MAG: hypothetical protein IJY35_10425, partial [Clostridia bacterium]|nr:hypothetical protein [Clostridia bacterium]